MENSERKVLVTRDTILKLLSDDEIARVSSVEDSSGLPEGEEYLDLESLDQGVQRAKKRSKIVMGHVISRSVRHQHL